MRPLGTSPLWEPSSDEDSVQGEVVITEESNIVLTQQVAPAWLGPRPKAHPKFLQPTPKSVPKLLQATSKAQVTKIGSAAHRSEVLRPNPGGEACSSTSRPVIDLTQEFPVIGNVSTSDLVDGLRFCHPPPGVRLRVVNPGSSAEAQLHRLGRSRPTSGLVIRLITEGFENLQRRCILGQVRQFLHLITIRCSTWIASASSRQRASRISFFPERHRRLLQKIRTLLEEQSRGRIK